MLVLQLESEVWLLMRRPAPRQKSDNRIGRIAHNEREHEMHASWISGLDLAQCLHEDGVAPVLSAGFPGMPYSACLLGRGSEVLGFDTSQSMDHDWGPKLMLFLSPDDLARRGADLLDVLSDELPLQVCGHPTNYTHHENGTRVMRGVEHGPVSHAVTLHTLKSYARKWLAYDLSRDLTPQDWLSFPEQRLRAISAGRVFHDGLGQLEPFRHRLHYYPDDVWLYLMACQWNRVGQEEAFVGRCGQVGDELGSAVVAARLTRDLMRLCFLSEREYAPYSKWLGSAFTHLSCGPQMTPLLQDTLAARSWRQRERSLNQAYEIVAQMHNALGITKPLPVHVSPFHARPFSVIHGDVFAEAISAEIIDPEVRALPRYVGGIDQYVDATDILDVADRFGRVRGLFT